MFIVSSENHNTLDIVSMGKTFNKITNKIGIKMRVSQPMSNWLKLYWQYHSDIIEIEIDDAPSCIDPKIFNNSVSSNFTTAAFQILSTKMLGFLEETPRRIFILSMCLSGVIGMVFGVGFTFIMQLIIAYFSK